MNRLTRQFIRYAAVGGLAFGVDFGALFVLTHYAQWHYLVSATVGFLLGLVTNYALCVRWIFDVRAVANRSHEFAIFGGIGLVGLALNDGLMFLLTDSLGVHYLLSKILAASLVLLFNFGARRQILFTARRKTA